MFASGQAGRWVLASRPAVSNCRTFAGGGTMRRYFIASAAAAIVALGVVHPVASGDPAAAPVQAAPAPTQTEADAVRQAQQTGQSVEITDQATETRQVLANPNGSFTLKSNQRAVRVKQDGQWKPIDTTLRRNTDGSWSPTATDQNVTFSGGGNSPVVTIRHGNLAL